MAKVTKSALYKNLLKAPLKNIQWSYGAVRDDSTVFLTVWAHHIDAIDRTVLIDRSDYDSTSLGGNERRQHVELIKAGADAYAVIAYSNENNPSAAVSNNTCASIKTDAVYKIVSLMTDDNGWTFATLGEAVAVTKIPVIDVIPEAVAKVLADQRKPARLPRAARRRPRRGIGSY